MAEHKNLPMWSAERSRNIRKRLVIEANLTLTSPAHFGNGDGDAAMDMPLLEDAVSGGPLLTGASLAGALRAHALAQYGGGKAAQARARVAGVFGVDKADDDGTQSALIVDDAIGGNFGRDARDGVVLDPRTRTAEDNKLFNFEVWQTGTTFPIRLELLIMTEDALAEKVIRETLATALQGLTDGSITLGGRKRRGYGTISIGALAVTEYDLMTQAGLLAWTTSDMNPADALASGIQPIAKTAGLAALAPPQAAVKDVFCVELTLALDGGILIRGNSGRDDIGPDAAHIEGLVLVDGIPRRMPLITGPSLAGALRARALRILNTLRIPTADEFMCSMFGGLTKKQATASRVRVAETFIRNATLEHVQNRVSIDRFTGGALDSALFNELPALPEVNAHVIVRFQLDAPQAAEIGLLLQVVKDLCTADLALGGTQSIGRGRLHCTAGSFARQVGNDRQTYEFTQVSNRLTFQAGTELQPLKDWVKALADLAPVGGVHEPQN